MQISRPLAYGVRISSIASTTADYTVNQGLCEPKVDNNIGKFCIHKLLVKQQYFKHSNYIGKSGCAKWTSVAAQFSNSPLASIF